MTSAYYNTGRDIEESEQAAAGYLSIHERGEVWSGFGAKRRIGTDYFNADRRAAKHRVGYDMRREKFGPKPAFKNTTVKQQLVNAVLDEGEDVYRVFENHIPLGWTMHEQLAPGVHLARTRKLTYLDRYEE